MLAGSRIPDRFYGEQHSYDGVAFRGTYLLHSEQMESEEYIISPEAMYDSADKCKKGKLYKSQVANFWLHGIEQSWNLSDQLNNGTYKAGKTHVVHITRPKKRDAVATQFRDRVYQRSLNDLALYPEMTKSFIYDNMACQQGKGTDLARARIKELLHRAYLKYGDNNFYILQCDVKGYYKNMKHEVTNSMFAEKLPPEIYKRTEAVLETQYEGDTGYNPGSQMVQIAGISFLDKFDHYVKEALRMREYMRYMDDFFMVARTREELEVVLPKINEYLSGVGLSTHPTKTKIFHQNRKMRVLGFDFHVTPTGKVIMQIDPKNVKDRRKNIFRCAQKVRKGEMTREKADEMFRAWLNHAGKGDNPHMIIRMKEYYYRCMEE